MSSFNPRMSILSSQPQKVNLSDPVMAFYEDGDWLRVEAQGKPTRYIRKKIAIEILRSYGANSFSEKSDLIIL